MLNDKETARNWYGVSSLVMRRSNHPRRRATGHATGRATARATGHGEFVWTRLVVFVVVVVEVVAIVSALLSPVTLSQLSVRILLVTCEVMCELPFPSSQYCLEQYCAAYSTSNRFFIYFI